MSYTLNDLEDVYGNIAINDPVSLDKKQIRTLVEVARLAWNIAVKEGKSGGVALADKCMSLAKKSDYYNMSTNNEASLKFRPFIPGHKNREHKVAFHKFIDSFEDTFLEFERSGATVPAKTINAYLKSGTHTNLIRSALEEIRPPSEQPNPNVLDKTLKQKKKRDRRPQPYPNRQSKKKSTGEPVETPASETRMVRMSDNTLIERIRDRRAMDDGSPQSWKDDALNFLVERNMLTKEDGISIFSSLQGDAYSGPFSQTLLSISRAVVPTNQVDTASMLHDLRYLVSAGDTTSIMEADRLYIQEDLNKGASLQIPTTKQEMMEFLKTNQAGLLLSLKSVADNVFGPELSSAILGLRAVDTGFVDPRVKKYVLDLIDFISTGRESWKDRNFYLSLQKYMINHPDRPRIVPSNDRNAPIELTYDPTTQDSIKLLNPNTMLQYEAGDQATITMDTAEPPMLTQDGPRQVPSLMPPPPSGTLVHQPTQAAGGPVLLRTPETLVPYNHPDQEGLRNRFIAYMNNQERALEEQRRLLIASFENNQRLHDQLSQTSHALVHVSEQDRQMVLQTQQSLQRYAQDLDKRQHQYQMLFQQYANFLQGGMLQSQEQFQQLGQLITEQQQAQGQMVLSGLNTLIEQQQQSIGMLVQHQNQHLERTVDTFVQINQHNYANQSAQFLRQMEENQKALIEYLAYKINNSKADDGLVGVYQAHVASLQQSIDKNHQTQSELAAQIESLSKRVGNDADGKALLLMVDEQRRLRSKDHELQNKLADIMKQNTATLDRMHTTMLNQENRINALSNNGLFGTDTKRVARTDTGKYVYLASDDDDDDLSDGEDDAKRHRRVRLSRYELEDRNHATTEPHLASKILRDSERDPDNPSAPSVLEVLDQLHSDQHTYEEARLYRDWRNLHVDYGHYTDFGYSGEPYHKRVARHTGDAIDPSTLIPMRNRVEPPGIALKLPHNWKGRISFEVPPEDVSVDDLSKGLEQRKQSIKPSIKVIEPVDRPQFLPTIDRQLDKKLVNNPNNLDSSTPAWDYEDHRLSNESHVENFLPSDLYR